MKINSIANNSFKALIEPNKEDYTKRQEKLAERVRTILNSSNIEDKKGRSYVDLYKEDFGLDLYIKPSKDNKAIDVLAHNNNDNSFEHLYNYKNILPKESDFLLFAKYIKEDLDDFLEKVLTIVVVTVFAGLAIWANNRTSATKQLEQLKKTELVQSQKNIDKPTATFIKNI